MGRKTKRIVILGDLHCGHWAGLTPPPWHNSATAEHPSDRKAARLQGECWEFYAATIAQLRPVHILIANGDLIDGRGEKSGGTELIAVDRKEQTDMALACLRHIKAQQAVLTYGTDYHVGQMESWEEIIADGLDAKIGAHEWVSVNGLVFDCKHHLASSSVPHGRHTAIARDRLWNQLWGEHDRQPKAQVLIRSHVHYHQFVGGPDWLGMTLPALQAAGTRYGARRCSGLVDYGLVHFDVTPSGGFTWQAHIARLISEKARPIVL